MIDFGDRQLPTSVRKPGDECGQKEVYGDHTIFRSSASRHGAEAVSGAEKLWCVAGVAHRAGADVAGPSRRCPSESP